MAMVDVDGVRLQDFFEFVEEGLSRCLYSKHVVYFINIVGVCATSIYFVMAQTCSQVTTCSLENSFFVIFPANFSQILLWLRTEDGTFSSLH